MGRGNGSVPGKITLDELVSSIPRSTALDIAAAESADGLPGPYYFTPFSDGWGKVPVYKRSRSAKPVAGLISKEVLSNAAVGTPKRQIKLASGVTLYEMTGHGTFRIVILKELTRLPDEYFAALDDAAIDTSAHLALKKFDVFGVNRDPSPNRDYFNPESDREMTKVLHPEADSRTPIIAGNKTVSASEMKSTFLGQMDENSHMLHAVVIKGYWINSFLLMDKKARLKMHKDFGQKFTLGRQVAANFGRTSKECWKLLGGETAADNQCCQRFHESLENTGLSIETFDGALY